MNVNKKNKDECQKHVHEFYLENNIFGKTYIIKHFQAENIPRRTIYDIIKCAENKFGHERKAGSGLIAK